MPLLNAKLHKLKSNEPTKNKAINQSVRYSARLIILYNISFGVFVTLGSDIDV